MDFKIKNILSDCDELLDKCSEKQEKDKLLLAGLSNSETIKIENSLKSINSDIRFLKQNIIKSFPYITIEEEEDISGIAECIEKLQQVNVLEDKDKGEITQTLMSLDFYNYDAMLYEYLFNLIGEDKGFIEGCEDKAFVVVEALRLASENANSNPLVDYYFNDYFKMSDLLEKCEVNGDNGKDLVKRICSDNIIDEKYKKSIKSTFQSRKVDSKIFNIERKNNIASNIATIGISPLLVVGGVSSGIIKLGGDLLNLATNIVALPFDIASALIYIAGKETEKAKEIADVVDFPGEVFRKVGKTTGGIIKYAGKKLDDLFVVMACVPGVAIKNGILKMYDHGVKSKIKKIDKSINSNIAKTLKENGKDVTEKDITLEKIQFDKQSNLVISGSYNDVAKYRFKYSMDDKIAQQLMKTMVTIKTLDNIANNIFVKSSKQMQQMLNINEGMTNYNTLLYKSASTVAHVTEKSPSSVKFDENSLIEEIDAELK